MTAQRKLVSRLAGAVAVAFVASLALTWLLHDRMMARDAHKLIDVAFNDVMGAIREKVDRRLVRQAMLFRDKLPELRKNPEGQYNPYLYDLPVLTEVKRVTLAIPDSLVFEEGIDPELGDPLEEPRILTAADFFKALEAAENGGIGFDAENIRITFDDDGEPVRIERNYSPAQ